LPIERFGTGGIAAPVTLQRLGHQGLWIHAGAAGFFTSGKANKSSARNLK
jgi:pyridoxal biosynthesis lyase PdxS